MFNHHVFISYAHIDNLPLSPEQEGWISRFHQTFSVFLSQRLGGKARIWRDLKLQGNDIFSDEIVDAYRDTALLISILSPVISVPSGVAGRSLSSAPMLKPVPVW